MKTKLYIICGLCFFLFSCQKEKTVLSDVSKPIYLRAIVENSVQTRVPYELTEPSAENPLKVAVWASTTPYVFQNLKTNGEDNSSVSLHTTANFTNGSEQLLDDAVYPDKDGTEVYFIGLHPVGGWVTPDNGELSGKVATKTFNGSEDVMFAPQISGKYAQNVNTWPTFKFRHLLTWLRVKVNADGEVVANAWGKLKSLKIKSQNSVTVDLNRDYDDNSLSFSGNTEFDLYKTGTDNVFVDDSKPETWYALPFDAEAKEVAYVLCAPADATALDTGGNRSTEYTLIVETENRTVEVPIDLMDGASYFSGNTMRHQFTVSLTFKMGSNIAVSAAVTDWVTAGIGNGTLDPNN